MAQVRGRADLAVVSLPGPLDARMTERLGYHLRSAPARNLRTLILDLDQVRYINSLGMTCLVRLSDLLEARGGALHLANAQPKVKLILEMMGLTAIFKLHRSVQAAVVALSPGRAAARPKA